MAGPYPFEDRSALRLVGWETPASNDDPQPIGALWQRLHGEDLATQVVGRQGRTVYAVYSDYQGDHTQPYTYFLGYAVGSDAPVPGGLVARDVPAGPYARIEAVGEQPGALIEAWMAIWSADLERSFQLDYEVHDPEHPDRVLIYVR